MSRVYVLILTLFFLFACKKTVQPSQNPLFQSLSVAQTGIDFSNDLPEDATFNIIQYLYYYNGAGVSTGDINNDGLVDIYFTSNLKENKLFLNKGNLQFEDITQKAGVNGNGMWKTGVTMADVNGDGWLDIYVCQVGDYKQIQGKNQLFINNGNLTFSEKAKEFGLDFKCFATQSAFFDYDKDGDLDCYLLCHSVHSMVKKREGAARNEPDLLAGDRLLRNDNGIFKDISTKAGIYSSKIGFGLGISIADVNTDGWEDIYVANDFYENDYLYYNNQNGTFKEAIRQSCGHTSNFSMGVDIADVNNDQLQDIFTLDMKPDDEVRYRASQGPDVYDIYQFKLSQGFHDQFPRNNLQLNRGVTKGKAVFSEIGQLAGVSQTDWSWACLFADLDNDGWKDIFVGNGIVRRPDDLDYIKFISNQTIQAQASDKEIIQKMPPNPAPNYAFRNKKDLTFENVSEKWGLSKNGYSNGSAYADLDNDGDLDLVVNNINDKASVFKNTTNDNPTTKRNFINIQLSDKKSKNPFAIGSKITLFAKNSCQTVSIQPTRGFLSSVDYTAHFGLDSLKNIDSLQIEWTDKHISMLKNVEMNKVLKIEKNEIKTNPQKQKNTTNNSFTLSDSNIKHLENPYKDNEYERLIPYFISTQTPKLCIADVNKDGLEDVLMAGAKGQGAQLFLQDKKVSSGFKTLPNLVLNPEMEVTNAVFFDADGDTDEDLCLVSGGNEASGQDLVLSPKLYLNDGKGNFSLKNGTFSTIFENFSTVQAADIDNDGDQDLFLGGRVLSKAYGVSPNSFLLLNDGKANFSDATPSEMKSIGMVADATWADLDVDKDLDLVLVGDWMPITVFKNENGKFTTPIELKNSSGLWNCVEVADFDKDGDLDLVAGNFGQNANLKATDNQPIGLYIKDFDNNGTQEQILSYYRHNKLWNFATKDELASQMPAIRKRFLDYKKFSQGGLYEIFPKEMLEKAVFKTVNNLHSAYIENKGNFQFDVKNLLTEAQFAPVQSVLPIDFNQDGNLDLMLGGNLYEIQPSIGKQDASFSLILLGNGKGDFVKNVEQPFISGQIRNLKSIRIKGKKNILIGRNNDSMQILSGF